MSERKPGMLIARVAAVILLLSGLLCLRRATQMVCSSHTFMTLEGKSLPPTASLSEFAFGVLLVGVSVLIFRHTSARQIGSRGSFWLIFLLAGVALLLGFFLVFIAVCCLLEAFFPESFGWSPDPELAPRISLVAVVLLAPALLFFRTRFSHVHLPAVARAAILIVELIFGVPLIVLFMTGLFAAIVPEFLNGVSTSSALMLSACTAILIQLLLGARLPAFWSWLRTRACKRRRNNG